MRSNLPAGTRVVDTTDPERTCYIVDSTPSKTYVVKIMPRGKREIEWDPERFQPVATPLRLTKQPRTGVGTHLKLGEVRYDLADGFACTVVSVGEVGGSILLEKRAGSKRQTLTWEPRRFVAPNKCTDAAKQRWRSKRIRELLEGPEGDEIRRLCKANGMTPEEALEDEEF